MDRFSSGADLIAVSIPEVRLHQTASGVTNERRRDETHHVLGRHLDIRDVGIIGGHNNPEGATCRVSCSGRSHIPRYL